MNKSKNVILNNITKEYLTHNGKHFVKAVDNVSFEIKPEEFVTLLEPSGCGKTTTLRLIAGFEISTTGDIFIGNKKVDNLTPDKREIAMVFQSYAIFPHLNVFDNVACGLRIKKMSKKSIDEKVYNILDLVDLKNEDSRMPNQLSGGQQQRVALARALVMEPSVLLFDEPLSNLDAKFRVFMRNEIKKIQEKFNLTSIYVTHDQSEAMSLSDRIILMNEGKIEQSGTPQELYQRPATQFVADFIGEANFFDGLITELSDSSAKVEIMGKFLTIPVTDKVGKKVEQKVKVVIRPEAVKIGNDGIFDGVVMLSIFMGSIQEYRVDVNGIIVKIVESNPMGKAVFPVNSIAKLSFEINNLHVI